ncbi:YbjQ family protein [Aliarcobacter butzleri]|uniref:YbjQ family protein n=1 Tax=Aliarcobacter butzleri TaxID=28197 RepID=UPI0012612D37|nr:heavy metal-binding domain-containing protein [Aliarcobacter butzleri]
MARCKSCNEIYSEFYLKDGVCEDCISGYNEEKKEKFEYEETVKKNINSILITTENFIDNTLIENRITIVSTQCILGINIIKDLFSFVRDIVGGRVNSLEKALNDATEQALNELKQKAYEQGGNAVIGVKIEHTYNNANSGSILSVMATGTVVKLKN